jgi:7-keto-8-aminopelargonate synthetase-like enzyme
MGPRASPLVCGYTHHHRLLESALAELKETEVHTFSKRIIVDTSLNLPIKN